MTLAAVTLDSTFPLFERMELKCVNKDMVSTEQPEFADGGNVMAILFSSSTTDKRKGIIIGYGEQLKAAKYQQVIFDKKTRYLSCFPICHISGFSTFWGVFLAGGRIGILEQINAVSLNKAFQTFRPTLFGMIPGVYENYQKKCEEYFDSLGAVKKTIISGVLKICGLIRTYLHIKLGIVLFRKVRDRVFGGNLKYLGVGGGILSQDVYTFFYNMGFLWVNIYALTELNVPVCFTAPERDAPQVSVESGNLGMLMRLSLSHQENIPVKTM